MSGQNLEGPFIPKTTKRLVQQNVYPTYFPLEKRQVGLHLDKFTEIVNGSEEKKKAALQDVLGIKGNHELFKSLWAKRANMLKAMNACHVEMNTAGPLTLHISRAGTWENAGICLHPIYGFAYIPGSGIKGLVRSWAETVWAQTQENEKEAWSRIDALFGYSDNSEVHKFISSPKRETPGWRPNDIHPIYSNSAGRLVFHDAWPKAWPSLEIGITNNHHTKHYEGDQDGHGDWEDPVPIYFLCVRSNTFFEFAISDRNPYGDDAIELASSWLVSALQAYGIGAKTAAGYGRFDSTGSPKLTLPTTLQRRGYELELVSPAFLAGANQKEEDCQLHGSTLRGLLRWWWRAMYAGKVDLKDLRRLEKAIWGSTETGSPVSIEIYHTSGGKPRKYTIESPNFLHEHGIPSGKGSKRNTRLGLFYTTYGMAEKGENRWYRPEKTCWKIVLTAKETWIQRESKSDMKLTAHEIERQASAALWLLCRYGGVGAKSRKGFGSLRDIPFSKIESLEDLNTLANDFLAKFEIQPAGQKIYGPSLDIALFEDISTNWDSDNPWFACHMIGETLDKARKSLHKSDRPALGMPRKEADLSKFPNQRPRSRHASPVLWSLSYRSDGKLTVRLSAFPSPKLPNIDKSEEILSDFIEEVKEEISSRTRRSATISRNRSGKGMSSPKSPITATNPETATDLGNLPSNGETVEAEILAETTKKGKPKAKHIESGWDGPIIDPIPEYVQPGQTVNLFVHAIHQEQEGITFKWTAPKKTKSHQSRTNNPKHSRGGGRRRR